MASGERTAFGALQSGHATEEIAPTSKGTGSVDVFPHLAHDSVDVADDAMTWCRFSEPASRDRQ